MRSFTMQECSFDNLKSVTSSASMDKTHLMTVEERMKLEATFSSQKGKRCLSAGNERITDDNPL